MMLGALALFPMAGCGQSAQPFGGCGTQLDAKIVLLWTVRGRPATATSCVGIADLDLLLSPDLCSGAVEIEPIVPCERDGAGWRYDNLPRGGATVQLAARDASGRNLLNGQTRVTLGPDLPSTATPIDLE